MAKGLKTGGRKKGTPNKTTAVAKEAIELAAEGIGGVERLIDWVKEDPGNERVFWSQMYTKLLPLQADVTSNGETLNQPTTIILKAAHDASNG